MVGPLMDGEGNPCASFQVLEAENAAEVGHWLAQEPIVRESVHRDALVGKFFVSKNDLPRQDWSGAGS